MEEDLSFEIAKTSLVKARSLVRRDAIISAFPYYCAFLVISTNRKHDYEQEFVHYLKTFKERMFDDGRFDDLTTCLLKCVVLFPSNLKILRIVGEHLLSLKEEEAAIPFLQKAVDVSLGKYLRADKALQAVKLSVVPRWHFRMLNDINRNRAYRNAIHNTISAKFNKVLDIGTGCGILSYYAAECKPVKHIYAIEMSNSLYKIAVDALNQFNVKVINQNSISIASIDIPLSNVLITEIFDAGLFGEMALETLIHAWVNLLEPTACIVPRSADLFITGFSSDDLLKTHRVCTEIPELNMVYLCITQELTEPYDAENLKQKDVKYITNTHKVLSIDFSNLQQLKDIYKDEVGVTFNLTCSESGSIHGFAFWFDLHLDENNTITTNPLKDCVTCWEQAIIYLDHPIFVSENQIIKARFSCANNKLKVKILDFVPSCKRCYKVSAEIISYLNDEQILKAVRNSNFSNVLPETIKRPLMVLDLNPFPLFSLTLAKKGYAGFYNLCVENVCDEEFIFDIWKHNGFEKFNENRMAEVNFHFHSSLTESVDSFSEKKFDIIFFDPLLPNGLLRQCDYLLIYKRNLLKDDGILYPHCVTLHTDVIDSRYLHHCSFVDDENLIGFSIAKRMNYYSVWETLMFDPKCYSYKILGSMNDKIINFYEAKDENTNEVIAIKEDGIIDGFLCSYLIHYTKDVIINTLNSTFYKKTCFLCKYPKIVSKGEMVTVNYQHDKLMIDIS